MQINVIAARETGIGYAKIEHREFHNHNDYSNWLRDFLIPGNQTWMLPQSLTKAADLEGKTIEYATYIIDRKTIKITTLFDQNS